MGLRLCVFGVSAERVLLSVQTVDVTTAVKIF